MPAPAALLLSLLFAASSALAQPAPATPDGGGSFRPGSATPRPTPQPAPKIDPVRFDDTIDARAAIASTGAAASKHNKRILIIWGRDDATAQNRMLATTLKNFHTAKIIDEEYEVVRIEVGDSDSGKANAELAESMNVVLSQDPPEDRRRSGGPGGGRAPVSGDGFHAVLSVHEPDGKLVDTKPLSTLQVRRQGEAQYEGLFLVDWLTASQSERQSATTLFETALAEATKKRKGVMLRFAQPRCVWCREFDAWLEEPNIQGLFDNSFVMLRIDIERTTSGIELFERFAGKNPDSLPWFVFLNAQGKALAASQSDKEPNIGYPSSDEEIARLKQLLLASGTGLSEPGLKLIEDSLIARREAIKAREEAARAKPDAK